MIKNYYKHSIIALFFILVIVNIIVFISGVALSDDISKFDAEISRLQQENLELEKDLYGVESLTHAASVAAELQFAKKSPVYIENIKVALR